jgi:type II secretion system protein I
VTRAAARSGSAGFTLLEALVALAILGVVMATVFGVIGSGLRSAHRDEDRLLLGLVAQNLLARSRLDLNPAAGALSGDIGGGLRWRIESEPYVLPDDILPEAPKEQDRPSLSSPDDTDAEARDEPVASSGFGARDAFAAEPDRAGFGSASSSDAGRAGQPGGIGAADATASGDGADTRADGQRTATREPLRLRLVKVTVEKGGERFELTGLAVDPPRERPTPR